MWINLLLGVSNWIFDDAYAAKSWLTGTCYFPMEGHRCCRTWNKHGGDVEWNGWWQYLNANENEVGFGEMLNVLYSRVVIWNHNVLSHVPVAARFPLHEGAGYKIKAPLLCQLQLYKLDRIHMRSIWSTTRVCTEEDRVFYSFTLRYKDIKVQFILHYLQFDFYLHKTHTNFAALQDNPFIFINTPLRKRLLKQHIIITFQCRGENKLPYLNLNFEMLIFLFRRLL